jgi:hypothetical protein
MDRKWWIWQMKNCWSQGVPFDIQPDKGLIASYKDKLKATGSVTNSKVSNHEHIPLEVEKLAQFP